MGNKPRISGVTFTAVHDVRLKVSHAERTDLGGREHHLPREHWLGNVVVRGAGQENEIATLHIKREQGRSPQAKRVNARPFWEGVIVLPTIEQPDSYGADQAKLLQKWCRAFEAMTSCTVLHACIHLDEGYLQDGAPQYNPHAHVLIDRTQAPKRTLWCPMRKELAAVQSMTAGVFRMPRGSTLKEREGAFARKHTPPILWRKQQELKSLLLRLLEELITENQRLANQNTELLKAAAAMRVAYRGRGDSLVHRAEEKDKAGIDQASGPSKKNRPQRANAEVISSKPSE